MVVFLRAGREEDGGGLAPAATSVSSIQVER